VPGSISTYLHNLQQQGIAKLLWFQLHPVLQDASGVNGEVTQLALEVNELLVYYVAVVSDKFDKSGVAEKDAHTALRVPTEDGGFAGFLTLSNKTR
jgi:hypothetical protein